MDEVTKFVLYESFTNKYWGGNKYGASDLKHAIQYMDSSSASAFLTQYSLDGELSIGSWTVKEVKLIVEI